MPRIVSIVEGKGESTYNAVPILVRRIAEELGFYVDCYRTVRTRRDVFPRSRSERERSFRAAMVDAGPDGAILVLLDSDGEPPCVNRNHRSSPCLLGETLIDDISPLAAGRPVVVVMAHREFEAWFVAAAPSLVGVKGLRAGVAAPAAPDEIRDPKRLLTDHMADPNQAYSPSADQARFTELFDMQMAQAGSPSFDAAYREIERLIRTVTGQ